MLRIDHGTRNAVRIGLARGALWLGLLAGAFACWLAAICGTVEANSPADKPTPSDAIPGGLYVQIGCRDISAAMNAARSGRFLVQVLDTSDQQVAGARAALSKSGLYGLAWAMRVESFEHLPYADNLVNVLAVAGREVPVAEAVRVLCPGGVLVVSGNADAKALAEAGLADVRNSGPVTLARKP